MIKKIVSLIGLLLIACFSISACTKGNSNEVRIVDNIENSTFEITVLDGGSQDSILLQIEDKVIMIDTGLKKNSDDILKLLNDKNIDEIDYLILTHMDKDHIGGAFDVLNSINVESIVQADYVRDSKEYDEYQKIIQDKNLEPIKLHENMNITIGKANIVLYAPEEDYYEESNDYSIMVSIDYEAQSFLFAGDAEKVRLKEYLKSDLNKEYTFLKVPHHGRMGKNSEEFFKDVNAKVAVITCSKKEPADDEVLDILNDLGTKIYLNMDGNITIKSDGENISITQ